MNQPPPPSPGVLRTSGAAEPDLGRRLGDLDFRAHQPLTRIAGTAAAGGVGWFVFRLVGPSSSHTGFGEKLGDAALAGVLVALIVAVLTAVVVAVKFATTRTKYARLIPAGAPMSAEFTAQGFGVQAGDYREQAALDTVAVARHYDDGLAVFVRDGKRTRAIVVPAALLPPQIAEEYPRRFPGKR